MFIVTLGGLILRLFLLILISTVTHYAKHFFHWNVKKQAGKIERLKDPV
jgi:hypothetical protein